MDIGKKCKVSKTRCHKFSCNCNKQKYRYNRCLSYQCIYQNPSTNINISIHYIRLWVYLYLFYHILHVGLLVFVRKILPFYTLNCMLLGKHFSRAHYISKTIAVKPFLNEKLFEKH